MIASRIMRGNRRMWKYEGLFLRFLATLGVLLIATICALAFVLSSRELKEIIEERFSDFTTGIAGGNGSSPGSPAARGGGVT